MKSKVARLVLAGAVLICVATAFAGAAGAARSAVNPKVAAEVPQKYKSKTLMVAADATYAPVVTRFRTYKLELERDADTYCETIMALSAMQEWVVAARNEPMIIDRYEF